MRHWRILATVLPFGSATLAEAQPDSEQSAADRGVTDLLQVYPVTGARHDRRGNPLRPVLTLNTRGGLVRSEALQVTLGPEHLTNTMGRTHGSGIDAPGTHVISGIDWVF